MYCLEYSRIQKAFHVQPVADMVLKNQGHLIRGKVSDWQVIYVGQEDDCNKFSKMFAKLLMINHK
jgi:hypothetical protein